MVGVGDDLLADVECLVPVKAALVQQNAHHLGDCQSGVGVVQLDGDLVGQVLEGRIAGQVVLDDIADGCGRQEVLLAQAQEDVYKRQAVPRSIPTSLENRPIVKILLMLPILSIAPEHPAALLCRLCAE